MANLANMSPQALSAWDRLKASWGGPLSLNSAYRDPQTNARVGGAKKSQHMHGNAFDVSTAGMTPEDRARLIQTAQASGFTGYGGYNNSLHFDVGPSRTWGPDYSSTSTPEWLLAALDGSQAVADDTMTALGLKPQGVLTSKNTESQPMIAEQPQARGLLDSLGIQKMQEGAAGETGQRFYERDTFKDTAATLAQGFAAMGSMPALQEMTANIAAQRTEQKARNKTVAYLRANGRDDLADMVEKGLIGGKEAAVLLLQKPKGLSDAEEKIQRLMSTGISRDTAIGIVDGSLVVSRDPVTGVATIVDKSKLGAQGEPPVIPPTETASDVFKDTNVPGALGVSGFSANVLNTLVDAFGGGQPADKIADASSLLYSLSTRTLLGLASEFPGRPSDLTREKIEALTIKPGEFGTGPDKALNMAENMIRTLEESLMAANRVVQGKFSPTDQAAARTSIDMLTPLLADYQSLSESLASKVTPPPSGTTLSPEVLKALERYNG